MDNQLSGHISDGWVWTLKIETEFVFLAYII